jgi:hypothetical protein
MAMAGSSPQGYGYGGFQPQWQQPLLPQQQLAQQYYGQRNQTPFSQPPPAWTNAFREGGTGAMQGPNQKVGGAPQGQGGPNLMNGMTTGGIMADYGNGSMLPGMAGRNPYGGASPVGAPAGHQGGMNPYNPQGWNQTPPPTPMGSMGFPPPVSRIPAPQTSSWSSQGTQRQPWRGPGAGTSGMGFT